MSSKYVLHFFNSKARAEISRLIFVVTGIEYTDNRIEDWDAVKADAPLQTVPYLEFGNVKLTQGLAIARYLAREGNIAGKTNLEQAQADAIVDSIKDGWDVFRQKVFVEAPADEKQEARKKYLEEDFLKTLTAVEKLISLYGKNGFSVGSSLTWSDLAIQDFIYTMLHYAEFYKVDYSSSILDPYPGVKTVRALVEADPKIAAWIKSRPDTNF